MLRRIGTEAAVRTLVDAANSENDWAVATLGRMPPPKVRPDDIEPAIDGRTVDEWMAWARQHLAVHDPLQAGASAVFRTIATVDQWTYRDGWRAD